MTANYTCVYAATNQVLVQALPPGSPPPATAQYVNGDCNQAAAALHPAGPHTGWVHPNGTTQDGVTAPNFTRDLAGLVLAELLGAARFGHLHRESGRRLAHLGGPVHAAAHLGFGAVPQLFRRRTLGLEQYDEPRVLLAVPSDSGHLVGSV